MMFNSMDAYGFLSIHPSLWFPLTTQQIPAVPPVGTTKKRFRATQVMKKLSHPNIIRCYGYFWDYPSQSLYIAPWPVDWRRELFRWTSPFFFGWSNGKAMEKTGKTHSKWVSICGCSYPQICWNRSWSIPYILMIGTSFSILSNRFWVLFQSWVITTRWVTSKPSQLQCSFLMRLGCISMFFPMTIF